MNFSIRTQQDGSIKLTWPGAVTCHSSFTEVLQQLRAYTAKNTPAIPKCNKLPQRVFNKLKRKSECDTGEDMETVGFYAEDKAYTISFYAIADDNYKLRVEDFGYMKKGKWHQYEPTEIQLNAMQEMIRDRVWELRELEEQQEEEEQEAIEEAEAWEKTKDFINANFHNLY